MLIFQVFDKGVLDDAEGRQIDFRNTIIILTSNAASSQIMQACLNKAPEERPTPDALAELIRPSLMKHFKPAFLGRLTVVPFYPIDDAVLANIIRLKPMDQPMLPFVMLPRPLQESNVIGKGGSAGFLGKGFDPYTLYPDGDDLDMTKMNRVKVDDLKLRPDVFAQRLQRRARLRDAIDGAMPEISARIGRPVGDGHRTLVSCSRRPRARSGGGSGARRSRRSRRPRCR